MCGIIGYVGRQDAVPILMDGLKRLEYRGYDSAGVAVLQQGRSPARYAGCGSVAKGKADRRAG